MNATLSRNIEFLASFALLYLVAIAAMSAQHVNPLEGEHVGMNVDNGHNLPGRSIKAFQLYSTDAPDFFTTSPQRTISVLT